MRSKLSMISSLLMPCFLCEHMAAMETEYGHPVKYPFVKSLDLFKAFSSSLEERESEEAKHRDEEGNFLIDYERMRVCDVSNTAGAPLYSEVINEIRPLFVMIASLQPIVMNFKGNYLQDEGVNALADFILETPLLKNQLKKLNLSNNRFKASCLSKLRELVEKCPQLETLNIAINYINTDEVNEAFQGLSSDKRKIVDFVPY